ncbi:MAG: hypothetical protein PVF10_06450 [Syntrophobacterales bacterium]|jgi:hypothetical protein
MKRLARSFALLGLATYVAVTLGACTSFSSDKSAEAKQAVPEQVSTYVLLVYELPFVYEEDNPRQEAFLSGIRTVVAPADWEKGPDSMTAIANRLAVNTTPENHKRLERFFDSNPRLPEQGPDAWIGPPGEKRKPE